MIEKSNPKNGIVPTEAEVGEKLEEIADGLRLETLNLMAAEYFEEDRKAGFGGANKQALERIEKAWKTTSGKLAAVSGKEVVHRLAEWVSKKCGVSLNAMKLAKELSTAEIDEEIRDVLAAIEDGEPFP